jgi:TusA-related sulfurtransferase
MNPGEILEVIADDPGFEKDFPAWCNASGEEFLGIIKEGSIIKGYVRRKK